MGETEHIRRMLKMWNHENWGFVIYRCTYADDAQWERFMTILNEWTRLHLEFEKATDLMESLDWVVQQGPDLDGASKDQVRRHFQQWVSSSPEAIQAVPRYRHCVMVDQTCLDSVLSGPQPFDRYGDLSGEGYVYVIDSQWEPETDEDDDEGYPAIEDCYMHDVGWMKVGLSSVALRTYNILEYDGWEIVYRRPPKTAMP